MRLRRGWRWLLNAQDAVCRATGDTVRILDDSDTEALHALLLEDPVANCYGLNILESGRRAGSESSPEYGVFFGIEDPQQREKLQAACWVGANIVPLQADNETGFYFGVAAAALGQRYASVFGPKHAVTGIKEGMQRGVQQPRSFRANQPLMHKTTPADIEHNPKVRVARPADFDVVFPAAVSMFTEELGVSPLANGSNSYRTKVHQQLRNGHILVEFDTDGALIFKADLGIVTTPCIQIQGVWVNPTYRGQHRAAANVAAVVNHCLSLAPEVSLYVNDFNHAALATYTKVGFARRGTFATVLF